MTTAQQLQEKKMASFNLKLMNSLIYRQERNNQVRQAALRLKYNYFPALDDDLWDWHTASPQSRGTYLRTVLTQREYNNNTTVINLSPGTKKIKKITKADKKHSNNSLPRPDSPSTQSPTKLSKRITKRSNTTGDPVSLSELHSTSSPHVQTEH